MEQGLHLVSPSTPGFEVILESIVTIHAACILNDHTLATFLPPLSYDQMRDDWKGWAEEAKTTSRLILIHVAPASSRSSGAGIRPSFEGRSWPILPQVMPDNQELEVTGVVSLSNPWTQTGPMRCLVQRLFVSPLHRRKKIATDLMVELEKQAWALGRWNVTLDTIVGSSAEHFYPLLGYEAIGYLRDYGISPEDGSMVDEVIFRKDLRKTYSSNKADENESRE